MDKYIKMNSKEKTDEFVQRHRAKFYLCRECIVFNAHLKYN